jgi:hypothetical protein
METFLPILIIIQNTAKYPYLKNTKVVPRIALIDVRRR